MEMMYTIGDEVRYTATGQFAIIIDDRDANNGYYDIRICGSDVEYHVHVLELN